MLLLLLLGSERIASAMNTVPTSYCGVPPPGPAMPVMARAKPRSVHVAGAPSAISRAVQLHRAVSGQSLGLHAQETFCFDSFA